MSAQKPKISILVPIYNVENYLEECLISIEKQSLKDIEVICINDGSTDDSLDIIKRFMAKDKRFKVVDKANSGYGDSMNKGLAKATGEYIGIVESDDFISENMFETLYDLASKNDAEIAKSSAYFYWTDTNKILPMYSVDENNLNKVISPTKDNSNIFYKIPSIWSAIYRRDFLKKNDIKFLPTPGASYQDTSFTFKSMLSADRVIFTDKSLLYYRQDNMASSMNNAAKKAPAIWNELNEIERFAKENCPDQLPMFYERKFVHAFNFMLYMRGKPILDFSRQIKKELSGRKVPFKLFQSKSLYFRYKVIMASPEAWYVFKRFHFAMDRVKNLCHHLYPLTIKNRKCRIKELGQDIKDRRANPGPARPVLADGKLTPKDKITVIIPTQDSKTLKKSVDSVINQTYKNLEIIIVDDGVTQESREEIKEIVKSDKRIKAFSSEQKGVAAARNIGLKESTAPFIMWCDSDDYLEPTACQEMLEALKKYNVDIVECGTKIKFDKNITAQLRNNVDEYLKLHYTGRQAVDDTLITNTDASLWNKLHKRSVIEAGAVHFPEPLFFEDAFFNDAYMLNVKNIYYLDSKLYNYHRHTGSVMSQTYKKQGLAADFSGIAFRLYDYMKAHKLYKTHQDLFWHRFFQHHKTAFDNLPYLKALKVRKKYLQFIKEHQADIEKLSSTHKKSMRKVTARAFLMPRLVIKTSVRAKDVLRAISKFKRSQLAEIKTLENKLYKIIHG